MKKEACSLAFMGKIVVSFVFILVVSFIMAIPAFAESEDWEEQPVITRVYEYGKEQIGLDWEGKADLYLIYIDGKKEPKISLKNTVVDMKEGGHQIAIVPVKYESKKADTRIDIDTKLGGGSLDLAAFGVEPKDLLQGEQSETLNINYSVSPLLNATPEVVSAYTDFNDNVLLTFTDKYDTDIYSITIKSGKDENSVDFDTASDEAAPFISKSFSKVTLTLDQQYLANNKCFVPELDQEYSFSVKLKKHPENMINGEKVETVIGSNESKAFD